MTTDYFELGLDICYGRLPMTKLSCCCGHSFFDHDPANCTRCRCRGYHGSTASQAVHQALDTVWPRPTSEKNAEEIDR